MLPMGMQSKGEGQDVIHSCAGKHKGGRYGAQEGYSHNPFQCP